MTPEREKLIGRLKFFNKVNFGFFLLNAVMCFISCWIGTARGALESFGFAVLYFLMIKGFDWYIGKLEGEKKDETDLKE